MPYLAAGIAVLGALTLLNLLLTYGVIRRLREHTQLLSTRDSVEPQAQMVPVGSVVGDFAATTVDGEPVSRNGLSGQTLVGFFSPDCSACTERVPDFVARAAAIPGGRAQSLAVIAATGKTFSGYGEQLAGVARVVADDDGPGSVAHAFGVRAYPMFAMVGPAGEVLAHSYTLDGLHTTVAV